jgi:formiminotetrahydrofolate cyclodeaminase
MPNEQPSLTDLSIADFLDRLAAGEPAPGGGSAAALAGALAAALTSMVCCFTIGKEEFAAVEAETKKILDEAEAARAALEFGVESDAAAFGVLAGAYRLPRDTEAKRQARREAIRAASIGAARAPLEVVRLVARVLDLCDRLAEIGNPRVLSDVAVAACMARAALHSAACNVEVNLPQLRGDPFYDEARTELNRLLEGRDAQVKLIVTKVSKRG